jgi:hypothetical protein
MNMILRTVKSTVKLGHEQLCPSLHEQLSSLRNIQRELQDLKTRLLTEGPSSIDEVKKALHSKREEAKKVREELELLLQEASPEIHKDTVESIKKMLDDIGNPKLSLDESFEGGIISLEIDRNTEEALQAWSSAKDAYTNADSASSSWIWSELDNISYIAPTSHHLDILVLNHGETSPEERDTLVEDLDKKGFRPLEFSELVALGIIKPEYNKRNEILNTYKKYSLDGDLLAPYLRWVGGRRGLSAGDVSGGWVEPYRFVFVRK